MEDQYVNGVVYFIQSPDGQIKIGTTKGSPENRLSALRGGSPIPLVLRAVAPGGRRLERRLHERFAENRLHGEWFSPAPELLALIDSFHSGQPVEGDDEETEVIESGVSEVHSSYRSKVARARLTAEENELYQEGARKAGLSPSEYLRDLILREHGLSTRLGEIERRAIETEIGVAESRVALLEWQVAQMLADSDEFQKEMGQEDQQDDPQRS